MEVGERWEAEIERSGAGEGRWETDRRKPVGREYPESVVHERFRVNSDWCGRMGNKMWRCPFPPKYTYVVGNASYV